MLIDHRTYRFHPNKVNDFIYALESKGGLDILKPMLPHMTGIYMTENGLMNEVVHLYAFESHEQRSEVIEQGRSHSDFRAFSKRLSEIFEESEIKILRPITLSNY